MSALQVDEVAANSASAGRRLWIGVVVVVAGVILANLLAQGLDRAVGGDQPGGLAGSSYATAPGGVAAYGTLLAHYGHRVRSQRGAIGPDTLPSDSTAIVLEPAGLTDHDASALRQFVGSGGRLVIGGSSPFYLDQLRDAPPRWEIAGARSWRRIDPAFADVREIDGAGLGSWSAPGSGRAVVGVDSFALLTRATVGRGEIYFLADASPLENSYLGTADNAAFALALAGDAGRPVVFPEGVHGFGAGRGWSAIPGRWKVALALVAIAAVAFAWSRARRFGPPDQQSRALPPARTEYVRALSVSLERTHDRTGALAPAQRWARTRLMARAGLGAAADNDAIVAAARSFGCTAEEVDALVAPVADDAGVLALGRAIVRIGGNGRMQ
ncbi:MAG: hypothetical protein QOG65_2525 [Actinomycetota bacterium]|jgi:hypothetical protein|nr:hypothetical protein [Actinomycetota bacterium]